MKSRVILTVFVVTLIITQTVFFVFTLYTYDRNLKKFQIDENKFTTAVDFACSNFLFNALHDYLPSSSSDYPSVKAIDVKVVFDSDVGFYSTYKGVRKCHFAGSAYGVGDYCNYGLIIQISDDRLYCRTSNGDKVIVRRGSNVASPFAASSVDDGADASQDAL